MSGDEERNGTVVSVAEQMQAAAWGRLINSLRPEDFERRMDELVRAAIGSEKR